MEDRIKIEGLGKLDGEYEISPDNFNNRDLHTIKQIAGVRAAELEEAWEQQDNDLLVAFTVIALRKAGNTVDKDMTDALWDAPLGVITLLAGDEEPTESPLAQRPPEPDAPANGNERSPSSGESSRTDLAPPQSPPSPIGSPPSDTGAISPPEILVT